ncbi:hypothetical protein Tco_0492525 [Tanacetum coccineum]
MHTRASNSELVESLPEPERTLNRRLRRRNRRVPYDQRNNPPKHPRIVYSLVLNINYFRHFLDILRNYDPMDDEPMWAVDHVVAPTPSSAITIPKTVNEFAIKAISQCFRQRNIHRSQNSTQTVAKNHQASIQNLETNSTELVPTSNLVNLLSGSLPQSVNLTTTSSPNDQQNASETLSIDSIEEDDESTHNRKLKTKISQGDTS